MAISTTAPGPSNSRMRPFRLRDLPPELVLDILELSILSDVHDGPISITMAMWPSTTDRQRLLQPPITRTCHLLRTEGLPLYYRHNTFRADCMRGNKHAMSKWLQCIGPAHAPGLRALYVSTEMHHQGGLLLQRYLVRLGAALAEWSFAEAMRVPMAEGKLVLEQEPRGGRCRVSFEDCAQTEGKRIVLRTVAEMEEVFLPNGAPGRRKRLVFEHELAQ